MIRFILLLALCTPAIMAYDAMAQTQVSAQPEKVFNAQSRVLDNGLQVVVIPNHRAPVITQMVWYKVGAADEPPGQSGIAHFLEHLMFKGSEDLKPGEFSRTIRAMGGNDNAFTSQDYTAYFQSVASEHLETVMRMEAGRMRSMDPPDAEVLSERKVILEERKQRTENDPSARLMEQMNAALYVNHPYGIPVIGWRHEMEELSPAFARSFYNQWYGPNNAILIVAGDVKPAKVFELAKTIYGPLARVDIPKRQRTVIPALGGGVTVTLTDPSVRQPRIQRTSLAPSAGQDKQTALALQVLEEIMSGGPASRLYKALVVEKKIATEAGLSYSPAALNSSAVWVFATPAPGIEPEAALRALDEELRKLIRDGVTQQELDEAIIRMQADAIYARDSLTGPAMVLGQALTTGSTLDDIEFWPRDIATVTAQQVQEAAKAYLDPDEKARRSVTGILLPAAEDAAEDMEARP